jgi:hypothetical protein
MTKLIAPGLLGDIASAFVLLAVVWPLVIRWQWQAAIAGRK